MAASFVMTGAALPTYKYAESLNLTAMISACSLECVDPDIAGVAKAWSLYDKHPRQSYRRRRCPGLRSGHFWVPQPLVGRVSERCPVTPRYR
jgi:hypothetical protein